MSGTVTLANLKTKIRQRADMVNSNFVADSELNGFVNDSLAGLYDLLIKSRGEQYFESEYEISLVSGTTSYDLPNDFFKVIAVVDASGLPIDTFDRREELHSAYSLKYNIFNNKLKINRSNVTKQIKLYYVPLAPTLDDDADTVDFYNGWDRYCAVDCAIMCLTKEESDTSALQLELNRMIQRIETSSEKNTHKPARVLDTQGNYYYDNREIR